VLPTTWTDAPGIWITGPVVPDEPVRPAFTG
jgi:hypothetical protein